MEGTAEKKLYDAAVEGNAVTFRQLLQQDPLLLDKVAVECSTKPSLLHIAAAKGHVEIASILLSEDSTMCWSRDGNGMNPIHVAAMKGHVDVLEKLVEKELFAAAEKLDRGSTVLHLCVKHGQLKALDILVERLGRLVCEKDDDGDTVLHLAVKFRHLEIVRFLMNNTRIDRRTKNSKNQTPLQILKESIHYSGSTKTADDKTIKKLIKFHFSNPIHSFQTTAHSEWLAKKRDAIMVVAILIATMAFQGAVNPPGGVWQEDTAPQGVWRNGTCHVAGEAVIGCLEGYHVLVISNSMAFGMSLVTILLLISGLPFRKGSFMWFLMAVMWTAVSAVGFTYALATVMVTPLDNTASAVDAILWVMAAWAIVMAIVMAIVLIGNALRPLIRWFRRRCEQFRRRCEQFRRFGTNNNTSSALHLQAV